MAGDNTVEGKKFKTYKYRGREKEYRTEYDRKRRYGNFDFRSLEKLQNGKCAICGNYPAGSREKERVLHVDHNHITGRVRGLLCNRCNLGLAHFGDDALRLRRAANYLDSHD